METKPICPSCQKTLPPGVPLGLCPECLIKSGFNTGTEPGKAGKDSGFVPPPAEELRRLFPQLEIIELIGKGGMGAVYKARQPTLDRFVALKILPPGAADDAGFAERFNREARALARLSHPHIVAVHDFGVAGGGSGAGVPPAIVPATASVAGSAPGGTPGETEAGETPAPLPPLHYLIMEFVDGPNLRQVEQAGRLTPAQALEIIPQICEALQFAHNEGVVHRDIKPENILLDKKGRVKITDFGIAKIVGVPSGRASLTGVKDVLGTPHYMAPEQVEHPQTVDHRADIYSLGVVFYEMLTGELPLGKFQSPSKKVQMDVRLDEVVLHALAKEPERRYQHVSEVKTDVETIAATPGQSGSQREEASSAGEHGRLPLAATRYNPWELAITVGGTTLFLAMLFLVAPNLRGPVAAFVILNSILGLVICALTFAGLWPFPSPFFPQPNFSSRNLRRRMVTGSSQATEPPSESESVLARARQEVKAPASWLVATGILNWIAIPLLVLVVGAIQNDTTRRTLLPLVPLTAFALSSVMIVAGLKMKRLEAYSLAITGSILAMLVTPGNVIGLPIGIWSLVVLSHREVRETFAKGGSLLVEANAGAAPPMPRPDRFWKRFAVAIVMILLALFMIPVGAILLSIALPALNRAKVKMQSKSEPAQLSVTFGPVMERVINASGEHTGFQGLDFESGQLWTATATELSSDGLRKQWIADHGVDLLVVKKGGFKWNLFGPDFKVARLPEAQWDQATPEELRRTLDAVVMETWNGWLFHQIQERLEMPLTFALQTGGGTVGLLQITGFTDSPRGVKLRYKLVQNTSSDPKATADQVIVEDLALQMLAAIRDKDDTALKSLATDSVQPGWRDALPQFATEMRERFAQMTGEPFAMYPTESLVEGDRAVVKCTGPKELGGTYLVLFFVKTADGWRNWSVRNSPSGTPLTEHLKQKPPVARTQGK